MERKGYQVVMAVDGQQAVDMAAAESPALILMDMLLEKIERLPGNKAAPP